MTKYDPTLSYFDLDLARGRQGELFVEDVRDALAKKNGRIEVKTDAYFFSAHAVKHKQQRFYIERESKGRDGVWRPSGIQTTKASLWFFVCGRHTAGFVFDTEWVRRATAFAARDPRNEARCDYGNNPTRGIYVYLNHFQLTRNENKDEH